MTETPPPKISQRSEDKNDYGLFELLWLAIKDIPRIMRTLKFAVWMILILAVFTLPGAILPQEKFARSPEEFSEQYIRIFNLNPGGVERGIGPFIYHTIVVPLQLYRVFETPLYLVLMCVLALSSALCAWDRAVIAARLLSRTKARVNPRQIRGEKEHVEGASSLSFEEASARLEGYLRSGRYRVFKEVGEDGVLWVFARKNAFRYYANVLMHFAFVFVIAGGIIRLDSVLGYEGTVLISEGGEGSSVPVGADLHAMREARKMGERYVPRSSERVELVDYVNIYREIDFGGIDEETGFPVGYRGTPSDYVSHIRVVDTSRGNEVLKEKAIEVNKPLSYKGVTYYQYAYDVEFGFRIVSAGGSPRHVRVHMGESFPIEGLRIPVEVTIKPWDFVGGIWEAKDGTQTKLPYSVRLVDYSGHGGSPILLGYVSEGKPLTVDGEEIHLEEVKEYTVIQYVHDPGIPLVALGGLLLAVGMIVSLYFPYKTARVMLWAEGGEVKVLVGSNWQGVASGIGKVLMVGGV